MKIEDRMSKHTPGPWNQDWNEPLKVNGNGHLVAKSFYWSGSENAGEPEANARLIAIAPRLLAACKRAEQLAEIATDWDLGDNGQVEIDGEWVDLYDLLREFREVVALAEE